MAGDMVRWTLRWDRGREVSAVLRRRIGIECYESSVRVEAMASEKAPVRSGDLAASGDIEQIDETHYAVRFGANLPDGRAIYQEYGTRHHRAQPYLAPAIEAEAPLLARRLAITTQGRIRSTNTVQGQAFHAANPLKRMVG